MLSFGVDTHKASLAASAVDELGRQVAGRTFANDPAGHVALLRWACPLATERRFGIEGAGSFGFALAQVLVAAGEAVVEVPPQFTRRERRSLRQPGKSDPRSPGCGPIWPASAWRAWPGWRSSSLTSSGASARC